MACPHCKTVMDFKVNDEIKQQLNSTLAEIEKIKSEYKGTVKFG
jgi:transcription initiation factor IIE alpha subunit